MYYLLDTSTLPFVHITTGHTIEQAEAAAFRYCTRKSGILSGRVAIIDIRGGAIQGIISNVSAHHADEWVLKHAQPCLSPWLDSDS